MDTRYLPSDKSYIIYPHPLYIDLNLLSWSASNTLAVALSQSVYLWDAASGGIKELMTLPEGDDYVSSVSWVQQGGSHLAVGTADNVVQIWDVHAEKQLRTVNMLTHTKYP